jgi:Cysteine-rich secretory protein family
MARNRSARSLRFDKLEGRQLLSSGGPTDQEQYMLQLINEARTNPAAAAEMITGNLTPEVQATLQYYGVNLQTVEQTIASATPQPPLAWNSDLANAAQGQSQYMANNQIQSHTGANGSTPQQRIQQAGYTNILSSGENAYAYASSVEEAMQAFLIDWGVPSDGHRINIQQPGVSAQNAYRDVGIGIVQTNPSNPNFGPMVVTQDFASQANSQAQLVGVAYYDESGTNFYQPGEGQGNLQIDAVNLQTGQVSSTQTWSSGGYELSLAPGQYRIIASLNDEVFQTVNITVGDVNSEQDFVLSNPWLGGTRESAIAAAQPVKATSTVPQESTPKPTIAQAVTPTVTPSTSTPSAILALVGSWSAWNARVS